MKTLILCFCIFFSLSGVIDGEGCRKIKSSPDFKTTSLSNQQTAKKEPPSIFRPIGNLFKRIFRKRHTIPYCATANVNYVFLSQSENNQQIKVTTFAKDPEDDVLKYDYTVSGGKIIGEGAKVVWDLSDVKDGDYTITAAVDDGCGFCGTPKTRVITVKECPDCNLDIPPNLWCPAALIASNKKKVKEGGTVTFTVNTEDLHETKPNFYWTISSGEIISGQNTQTLTIKAKRGTAGNFITATVDVGNEREPCENPPSYTIGVTKP